MSASPQLHYLHETGSPPRAYNSAATEPQRVMTAMSELWKQWEGRLVNGEFPLQRYLGGSDHSAVFLTQHGEGLAQSAAIKLILADPDKAEGQLFRWRSAAKLSHPGLIRIFATGRSRLDETELLYLVMERADEDLSQILPQRPLTPVETRDMLSQIGAVLGYVHSKGFIHGCIKPSNVMAIADRVKLSSDSICTLPAAAGLELGGSRYTPPEATGEPVAPAADVWSFGMTLVEALTQRLPVLNPALPEAVVLPDGLPEPFLGIARQCLLLDPRQRWTIADITTRLEPAPVAANVHETPAPAIPSGKKLSANWLYVAVVVAAGLIAVVWMSGSKTKTSILADRQAQVEPRPGQPASPPAALPAKPGSKPSAETPAKTPSAEQTQGPTVPAPPVAALPDGATPKLEEAPPLKASTANGVVIPGVVHSVVPEVPRRARNTIQGKVKVRVRVQVDASGNVVSAVLDSRGPSKYFARLALDAAQGWKFTPAQAQGQFVASEWILRFTFSRSDTNVVPKQNRP